MLQSKKGFTLTPRMKRVATVATVAIVISVCVFAYLSRDRGTLVKESGPSTGGGAVQVKSTAFNGVDINTDDPIALRAYCEDIITSGEASGDKIRDLCVLNDIVREHLPSLTNVEIQDLAKNSPSCLQTGFDADGFNCFTGFDENNCSREGIDPDGNICDPSLANKAASDPIDSLFSNNVDVCSIVSGCQAESEFDENGENRFGCNREGRRSDGTMCPAEFITRLYDENNRDQLGFDPQGFNEFQCDIQGLRADGSKCPLEQVTRVYDKNNRDQWGFHQDSFNDNGCNIEGLNRDGNACALEDITRIIDPKTGLDQFGISEDGYNENGCSLEGYNRSGVLCKLEDITRIIGKDGKDQFGIFESGFNDAGCSIEGLKADGTACKLEDAPRLFNPKTGTDQFSFFKNNKNKYGCDELGLRSDGTLCPVEQISKIVGKDNLDANGLTLDGFAENGCSTAGFRRNGKRCDSKDIPRVYDSSTGLDQFKLDKDGFSADTGCNLEGFNREGERCTLEDTPRIFDPETGLDQFSLTKSGLTKAGCGLDGLNAMGQVCSSKDIPRIINPETGLDQFGLDSEGFHFETGCNLEGYNRDGVRCEFEDIPQIVGKDGVNQLGLTTSGRNAAGCDINGIKEDGTVCTEEERTKLYGNDGISQYHKNSDGFTRLGVNDMQYNDLNCNLNGQKPNGELCEIDEITRIYDPETGLDQFGLTKDGFNEYGCSLEGLNRESEACPPEHIPRIFSSDMKDQFGTPINELPDSVWLNELAKKSGLSPLLDESGKPVFKDGKAVFVGKDGVLRSADGVALRDSYGGLLKADANGKITDSKGKVVPPTLFEDKDGIPLSGPFKVAAPENDKLKKLTSQSGSPVSVKGKPAFVDEQGMLVDGQGNYILGENGNPLRLNDDGDIVDSEGNVLNTKHIKDAQGNEVNGKLVAKSVPKHAQVSSLTNKDGEPLLVDGKPAFVDDSGYLIDDKGELILSEDGLPLRLDPNGNIYDANGNVMEKSRLTNLLGEPAEGPFSSRNMSDNGILTAANGEPVMIDGEAAYLGKDGFIRNAKGELLKGDNGQPLRLNKNGEIVNSAGEKVDPKRLTLKSGNSVEGPIRAGHAVKHDVLTTANGETVTIDGEKAFVRKDGVITDALGNPILGNDGKPLRLNASGEVVDSSGRRVRASRLKTVDGKAVSGPLHAEDKSSSSLLTDSTGEPILIDGKAAFVDEDGVLRDAQGNVFKGADGKPLKLNRRGEVIDSSGEVIEDKRLSTITGKKVRKPLKSKNKISQNALTTLAGEPVTVDGVAAFVDENGVLRDVNGGVLLDDSGRPLTLNDKGQVVDSEGKPIATDRLKTMDGKAVTGGLKVADDSDKVLSPLVDKDGKVVHYNGEPVIVGKDGKLRDMSGKLIFGPNGKTLRLDDKGQVINSDGEVITADHFQDSQGNALEGTFSADTFKSKTQIEAAAKADALSEDERNALQLDEDGYNPKGCDLNGRDRNGDLCELEDMPRVFDEDTGLDQFGLTKDNYNSFGCSLDGLNRNGKKCDDKFIPRIRDSKGFDQFGTSPSGFRKTGLNANGENALGCDAFGEKCGPENSPSLTDSKGVSQFGKLSDGKDRLGLINGFNDAGCGLDGLDAKGNRCALEDIPLFLNEDGLTQFGTRENGYNDNNCNIEGLRPDGTICPLNEVPRIFDKSLYDQFNLNSAGRNAAGCNLAGFKVDGTRCKAEDIPRMYDAQKVDQFGLDEDGFSIATGCNLDGVNREGKRCSLEDTPRIFDPVTGLDQFSIGRDGFNDKGCNLDGVGRDGKVCAYEDITLIYDKETGKNQLGFGEDTYNDNGCDFYGYSREGTLCKPEDLTRIVGSDNKDQYNIDVTTNMNDKGCDIHGRRKDGSRCKPENMVRFVDANMKDQFGLVKGYNEHGCDLNGRKEDGTLCDIEDVTRVIDETTGLDQFELDENHRNEHGCGIDGLDKHGIACKPENLTHIYNDKGIDQFNLNKDKRNVFDCNLLGFKPDGSRCSFAEITSIRGKDGLNQLALNEQGFNEYNEDLEGYDPDGCDAQNRKRDGSYCSKYKDNNLDSEDGAYITRRKSKIEDWLKQNDLTYKQEVEAPYMASIQANGASSPATERVEQSASSTNRIEVDKSVEIADASSRDGDKKLAKMEDIRIPLAYMTQVNVSTPVNSDYTNTVYARITLGELAGAVLVGKVVVPYIDDVVMPRDKFYYEFNQLIWERQTIAIKAISINPYNDSSMVDADEVDYHRLQRYGGLLFASAVEALDASFLDNQVEQDLEAQSDLINSISASTAIYGQYSRELAKTNLQTATAHVSDLAKQQFTRRPTIKSGPGLTLIAFTQQVSDPRIPYVMVGVEH